MPPPTLQAPSWLLSLRLGAFALFLELALALRLRASLSAPPYYGFYQYHYNMGRWYRNPKIAKIQHFLQKFTSLAFAILSLWVRLLV